MKTTLYFYTGTGNSLWTAKKLSEILRNTEIIPITLAGEGPIHSDSENIGLIFPVHIWGIPLRVIDFLNRLETDLQNTTSRLPLMPVRLPPLSDSIKDAAAKKKH